MAEPAGKGTATATTTARTDPGPPPELLDWLHGLIRDGLCLPLEGGRYRLRLSQASLARHMGLSPGAGTLSRRLRVLADCGVVLSRRPLVFRLPTAAAPTLHSVPSTLPTGADLLARLTALCAQAIASRSDDVALAALGCLAQAMRAPAPFADPARDQRGSPSIFSTDFSTDFPADVATDVSVEPTPDCSPSTDARPNPSSPPAALSRVDPASVAEVFAAIEPLLATCDRLGLPGVTNPRGLLHAVVGVDRDDLETGARLIAEQLRANVPLRSPVGVLIALARRGDLAGVAALDRASASALDPRRTEPCPDTIDVSAGSVGRVDDQQTGTVDLWWEELTRLERDDPSALCRLTGDTQPWLAKLRAYTKTHPAPVRSRHAPTPEDSGRPAAATDGAGHGFDPDPLPCDP